jgi:hypothetical protein
VVLPSRWAGVDDFGASIAELRAAEPGQAVEAVAGKPAERSIRHRPGERVLLQYQVRSPIADIDAAQPRSQADLFRTRLGARWFEAFGHGMLATVADLPEGTPARLCIDFDGLPENSWWIGSHGALQGSAARLRLQGSQSLATHAVYLGGELQVRERRVVARHCSSRCRHRPFAASIDAVADRAAQLIDASAASARAGAWITNAGSAPQPPGRGLWRHVRPPALVMHAANLAVPGDLLTLVTHGCHRWFPDRFGPLAYQARRRGGPLLVQRGLHRPLHPPHPGHAAQDPGRPCPRAQRQDRALPAAADLRRQRAWPASSATRVYRTGRAR